MSNLLPDRGNIEIAGIAEWAIKATGDTGYVVFPFFRHGIVMFEALFSDDAEKRPDPYAYQMNVSAEFFPTFTLLKSTILLSALGILQIEHRIKLENGQYIMSAPLNSTPSPTGFGTKWKFCSDNEFEDACYIQIEASRRLLPAEFLQVTTSTNVDATASISSDTFYEFNNFSKSDIIPSGIATFQLGATSAYGDQVLSMRGTKFEAELLSAEDDRGQFVGNMVKIDFECEPMEGAESEMQTWNAIATRTNYAQLSFNGGLVVTLPVFDNPLGTELGFTYGFISASDMLDIAHGKVRGEGIINLYDFARVFIDLTNYTVISSKIVLSGDADYSNGLYVTSTGEIDANNFKITVNPKLICIVDGHIHNDGNDGSGINGGAAKANGTYQSQGAGTNGVMGPSVGYGNTNGANGVQGSTRVTCLTNTPAPICSNTGNGGNSTGNPPIQKGGNPGASGPSSTVNSVVSPSLSDILNAIVQVYIAPIPGSPGSGGMGGGDFEIGIGGPGADSPGTGSPAGVLNFISGPLIGKGRFSTNGGNGADGNNGTVGNRLYQDSAGNWLTITGGGGATSGAPGGPGGLCSVSVSEIILWQGIVESKGGRGGKKGLAYPTAYAYDAAAVSVSSLTGLNFQPTIVGFASYPNQIYGALISGVTGNTAANGQWAGGLNADFPEEPPGATSISLTNVKGNGTWNSGTGTIFFGNPGFSSGSGQDGPEGNVGLIYINGVLQ